MFTIAPLLAVKCGAQAWAQRKLLSSTLANTSCHEANVVSAKES